MPLGRRRPLARDAAIGAVAYEHGEHRVHASGALTDEEFSTAKAKALGL